MIRQGFVSNSSSSSFIIRVPEEKLEFDQILDYYKVNKELSPKFRAWLNIIIDNILEQSSEEYDEDDEYDDDYYYYYGSGVKEEDDIPYILRDHYKDYFKKSFPHKDLTEEELEAIRLKAIKSFEDNSWISYYLQDYGTRDSYDLEIPWSISRKIGEECSNIFTDPSVAMAERC